MDRTRLERHVIQTRHKYALRRRCRRRAAAVCRAPLARAKKAKTSNPPRISDAKSVSYYVAF